jgi:hypothetical protein
VVATVLMATLVVGPFHLSRALGLDARVPSGWSCRPVPLVAAAHRRARRAARGPATAPAAPALVGLTAIAVGVELALALLPLRDARRPGLPRRRSWSPSPASYALFQAANNTAVMKTARSATRARPRRRPAQPGAEPGPRDRHGRCMGAVFALASGSHDPASAPPDALATGMRVTFAVGAALVAAGLALVALPRSLAASDPHGAALGA